MVFSSAVFLFFFLPLTLAGYYILPEKAKNIWLLFMSLFFYAWGGIALVPVILYTILLNYAGGGLLEYTEKKGYEKLRKWIFILVVLLNIGNLGYWKYGMFFLQIVRGITGLAFDIPEILLPIGISFYTFQGMSYVIDLYRRQVPVQKSIWRLGLYIALFPQLIAGPIVRYSEIDRQLTARTHSVKLFAAGIRTFTGGLAKKAIIANSLAVIVDEIFEQPASQNTPAIAWVGIIGYTLQIYFDFSGYSDMAVGLARMFGFQLGQNFNYPYISHSMSELWRRWHISLSSWFRDYVYIPLGGSRKGNVYFHLFVIFLLTGIWHGASWNYIIWGLYSGFFVILERLVTKKLRWKIKLPGILCNVWTLFCWTMGFVIFRIESLPKIAEYYKSLFGLQKLQNVGYTVGWYLHRYEIFIFAVAFAAMLPAGKKVYDALQKKIPEGIFMAAVNMGTLVLLGISIIYVVTGTYNPFIYFQF